MDYVYEVRTYYGGWSSRGCYNSVSKAKDSFKTLHQLHYNHGGFWGTVQVLRRTLDNPADKREVVYEEYHGREWQPEMIKNAKTNV